MVFIFLDFVTVIFLHRKVFSLASKPQHGGAGLSVYVPTERVAQLYHQAPDSISVAF
jgi:hypothetical protein